MRSWRWMQWRPWRSSRQRERDLDKEISAHLELEAEDFHEAGLPLQEARDAAQRVFGNRTLVREDTRAVWTSIGLERLRQDVRYAVRIFTRSPGFSAVILIVLALGIGANTTIFSIVNSVLLRPLAFRHPDRLVMLEEKWLPRFARFEASPLDFVSWKDECQAYSDIAAFVPVSFNMSEGDRPERLAGARVSANLPSLLGVAPILGRDFRPEEDTAGSNHVVLLGHGLWQRRFNADPSVIGRVVRMNGIGFTVVGVMPAAFRFPREAEIWMPMGFTPQELESRGNHFIWAVGRLKPDVTHAQAQAEMDILMPRLQKVWRGTVLPLTDYYVGEVRLALSVLLGAAGFVLLIACANVANLLLARNSVRQREMSLRTSLGATRGRIVQQLLTETLWLASLGGVLGLLLAQGGVMLVRRWPMPAMPRLEETSLDYRVLLFTIALSIGAGLLFGLSPALRLSRPDLHDALKTGGRATGTERRTRVRNALVITELALALVLLAGAGLLLKSLWQLLDVPLGFSPRQVLTVTINLPAVNYREPFQQNQFAERLVDRLGRLPDVQAVGISTGLPFSSVADVGIQFDGGPGNASTSGTTANYYGVTPAYLGAMQIPLIRGRLFTERDLPGSPPVVLINETMARRFFPDEDPIGKRLDISGPTYLREIVGIVGDVRQEGLRTPTPPQVYEPFFQKPSKSFHVLLRATENPMRFADTVRQEVQAIDRAQPISQARPMDDIVALSLTRDRFSVVVLGGFAALALILAAVGIYGVMAYAVTQRTNEIGIRMALGAQRQGILQLILSQSLRMVLIGLGIGLVAAFALTSVLGNLLYEVKPRDPVTFVIVSLLLFGVALAAAFIPAHRASRVDPVVALRAE